MVLYTMAFPSLFDLAVPLALFTQPLHTDPLQKELARYGSTVFLRLVLQNNI